MVVGGVTTNQVILFSKDKVLDVAQRIRDIIKIIGLEKSLSVELPDSEWSEAKLLETAKHLNQISPENIVIKVPILTNSEKGLRILSNLSRLGIRTNATIGINFGQLTMAAEASRSYKGNLDNYISVFWGRAQESVELYHEGMMPEQLVKSVRLYLDSHRLTTKIIVGSIRNPEQVPMAFNAGADIVTISPVIMDSLLKNQRALETTKEFDNAFRAVEKKVVII